MKSITLTLAAFLAFVSVANAAGTGSDKSGATTGETVIIAEEGTVEGGKAEKASDKGQGEAKKEEATK